jgi:beta-glucosidase
VHDVKCTVPRAEQELKAFSKLELRPGETKTVRFRLDREAFWHYDADRAMWLVEPGEFEVRVGQSSRSTPLHATVHVSDKVA